MARVHTLNAEVARKIAAGELIDRPAAIVRELMDNAIDSGAKNIRVEIEAGGIEKVRVSDDGCGMDKEDLAECAHPHATSKISEAEDLLNLTTLGFRGEALSSMAAVSRLSIISGGYKMCASVTQDHEITSCPSAKGTIVQTEGLFENFPARRQFLKRPASEASLCRSTFEEKALARPDIAFTFVSDKEEKLVLPKVSGLTQRFIQTMQFFETEDLFHEITGEAEDKSFSFTVVIGGPSVSRNNRKNIFIYTNGRRISEYSLMQAIEYGCEGYFPNGTHPVACLFVNMKPSLVDFNIHPAKKEARFKDIGSLHHAVSSSVKNFFKKLTVKSLAEEAAASEQGAVQYTFSEQNQDYENGRTIREEFSGLNSSLRNVFSGGKRESFFSSKTSKPQNIPSLHPGASFTDTKGAAFSQNTAFAQNSAARFLTTDDAFPQSRAAFSLNRDASFKQNNEADFRTIQNEENDSLKNEQHSFNKNYINGKYDDDGFHFAGSVLGTFLLAEKNNSLYIIDQHAAHERILFNKMMEESGKKQELIVPYVIQTESKSDDNFLKEISKSLNEAGFSIKEYEDGKWEISSVPLLWKCTEEELKTSLLVKRLNPADIIRSSAASASCRAAVMDGTVLDEKTASDLAKKALLLEDPHCPHGRPVYTVITREQLFALVKRT